MFKIVDLYINAGQKEMLVWAQKPAFFPLLRKLKRICIYCTINQCFGRVSSGVKRPFEYLAALGAC